MIFTTDKTKLTIELHGREQMWAVKARVVVDKKDIVDISFKDVFKEWRKWEVRLPGAGVPGKLVAGSFWTEEGWDFLYLKDPHGWLNPFVHDVLYIETKQQKFKRVIVSCDKEQAKKILKWAKTK
jgi:hypothetical protein